LRFGGSGEAELVGDDNEPIAVLDLAWPDGLQEGYSQPVALIIDEDAQVGQIADHAGYLFFTNPVAFQQYVRQDILAIYDAAD